MLALNANAKLFLCDVCVNMHKSFDGLSAVVEKMFPSELLSGAFFIFLSRRKDQMKVLYWDGDGFVIFYKRLEIGRFFIKHEHSLELNRREFFMLLEGIIPKRLQKRFCL